MLAIALTGSEGGEQDMEKEAHDKDGDDLEQEKQEKTTTTMRCSWTLTRTRSRCKPNHSANKKFLIAHRLLDNMGFKNNSLLESVLSSSNEVSGLVQKQPGMGLSMGCQMAMVLKEEATSMRLRVVSGTTPDGDWKEAHTSTFPSIFKMQRSFFAQELESRFQVDSSPDKNTLLALKLDPSVNTTVEDGNLPSRTAAQQLMMGEYRRRLVRRHKLMFMAANFVVSSVSDSQVNFPAAPPGKRGAQSMGGVAKKGPASVL
jgi:hypothetical protein